ncbi:cytochrome C oxidase copper chaperone [Atractiella rhizophila]|nr:cytochrome C oxidase copper chaperone [Atractiella rhizophila]
MTVSSWFGWGNAPVEPVPEPPKQGKLSDPSFNPKNPKGIKPCCACPETKSARDECFLRLGPDQKEWPGLGNVEGDNCRDLVRKHRECMESLGFTI